MRRILSPNMTRTVSRQIDLVVIHTMEAPEKGTTAESVAAYLARPATRASAHYCLDSDSTVRGVYDHNVAWHAPGANHNGLGLEHAGYARQSAADWADPYSRAMLARSARLTARLCARYDIPVVFVDAAGLKAGKRGITTHREVTAAFHQSTHTDPGAHFPMTAYLQAVRARMLPVVSAADVRAAWHHDGNHKGALHPEQVKLLQRALGKRLVTGRYGDGTRRLVRKMYPDATHGLLTGPRLRQLAAESGTFRVKG